MALDLMIIYKVYKLYFIQPEAILLLFGLEGCSVLLWFVFIGLDQNLSDWQITNHLLKAAGLDGSEGDERGWNMLAVLRHRISAYWSDLFIYRNAIFK